MLADGVVFSYPIYQVELNSMSKISNGKHFRTLLMMTFYMGLAHFQCNNIGKNYTSVVFM